MVRLGVRRVPRSGGSLTAASNRITDPSKSFKSSTMGGKRGNDWQDDAWNYLEHVGELAYYVSWRSSSVSRCRLIASEMDPDTGKPTGECSNERVNQIVRDIAGGANGQSQLLAKMTLFLSVPGEGFIAMLVRDPGREREANGQPAQPGKPFEQWVTLAREEIKTRGADDIEITLPDGKKHTFNRTQDLLFRVWNPHPRNSQDATSPTRSSRDALNEIMRTTATIANAAKSRLVGNGIVFVPQEMSLPSQATPVANPVGTVPGAPITAPAWQKATTQDLQDLIYNVAEVAHDDPDSMAAFIPIFAAAPGEWIKNVTHLKFDSTVSETALKTREAAITRLARSLDVAPERLLGIGSNSNHWSAWAIGEDDVKIHLVPVLETIADALNREVLRAVLESEGIDPDLYCVWHDTTALTQNPDRKDEAAIAHERGGLTTSKFREALGFTEEDGYDLNTLAGWQELARDRVAADISLLPSLAPLLQGLETTEIAPTPAIEPTPTPADETETDTDTIPEEPTDDEEGLTAAAYTLGRFAFSRAMELANKRRRTRSNHGSFDGVALHEAHVRLDRVADNTAALSLIEGWDSIIEPSLLMVAGLDPVKFRRAIETTACMALRDSRIVNPDNLVVEAKL